MIEIKLNTAFGELIPNDILVANDEIIEFAVPNKLQGKGVLIINALSSYVEQGGIIAVPASELQEFNTLTLVDVVGEKTVKKWALIRLIKRNVQGEKIEYADELEFYKNNYVVLSAEVKKLKDFQENATKDIAMLINAVNTLNEEFKAVREEMSL